MLTQYILLPLLAATVSAIAGPVQTPAPVPRGLFDDARDLLHKIEGGADCISAAAHIGDDLPAAPTGALLSAIVSVRASTDIKDNCLGPFIPSSLSSSYSAYESEFVQWYRKNRDRVEAIETGCGTVDAEISSRVLPCATAVQAQVQQQPDVGGAAAPPVVTGVLGAAIVGAAGAVLQLV